MIEHRSHDMPNLPLTSLIPDRARPEVQLSDVISLGLEHVPA